MFSNESAVLSSLVDETRSLTLSLLSQIEEADRLYQNFQCDGKHLNSAFWIMAHLSVTQNYLLLKSTGGESLRIPYARQFGMGAVPPPQDACPPLDEVRAIFNEVHQKSVAHINTISAEQLEQKNTTGFSMLGKDTMRSVIVHAIRHENMHTGHLSWLCKLNGLKTI